MGTSGLLQILSLHETGIIHDSMNRPNIDFISYNICISYCQSNINFHFSPNLVGFTEVWKESDITVVSE